MKRHKKKHLPKSTKHHGLVHYHFVIGRAIPLMRDLSLFFSSLDLAPKRPFLSVGYKNLFRNLKKGKYRKMPKGGGIWKDNVVLNVIFQMMMSI